MECKNAKILVIVEGEKTDVRLMKHLLRTYGLDKKHAIVSYNTNIYTLYNDMFRDDDPESYDILQVLKSRESDEDKKRIFDEEYSDILLIFDFDPQDVQYDKKKIIYMQEYFSESSDMGKLYINYPMVEAFYHMKSIPDIEYIERKVTKAELKAKGYKKRVHEETFGGDYRKFAETRNDCNTVIKHNIEKAFRILKKEPEPEQIPSLTKLVRAQTDLYEKDDWLYVLCTCVFYIVDYNPSFIFVD